MLDTELPEPTPDPSPAPVAEEIDSPVAQMPAESGPSRLLRLADMERRIKRTEETLEDLVWLVTRLEQDATTKLKA
ncbi:MAG: hypothetical protein R2706_01575 [Acidimicrobiales bacterium]